MTLPRRLPPYAKPLANARRQGLMPRMKGFGHVAVVLDWQNTATAGLHRIVVPRDMPLEELDLTCLRGLQVLLTYRQADAHRVEAVVDAILKAGAQWVEAANLDLFDQDEPMSKAMVRLQLWDDHGT